MKMVARGSFIYGDDSVAQAHDMAISDCDPTSYIPVKWPIILSASAVAHYVVSLTF